MAAVGSELVSSFVIKELTGDKRELTLKTRALPYRPFTLEGSQRNSIDWYPGSPVGVLQVYGAKEEPTTITGQWKDAFLGVTPDPTAAPAVVTSSSTEAVDLGGEFAGIAGEAISISSQTLQTARSLVGVVDDMRRKGQQVEVTWLDQIRRGLIDRFVVRWNTGHDCEWEIGFVWISQGDSLTETPVAIAGNDLGDLPNRIQDSLNDLAEAQLGDLGQAGTRFADVGSVLSEVGANIQAFNDSLTDAIVSVGAFASTSNDAMRRVSGILDGIKIEAEELILLAEGAADGALLDSGSFNQLRSSVLSFGQLLAARGNVRDQSATAANVRNLAAREQQALLNQMTTTVISVFQAREGQDLRAVSQQFYNTPDEWRALMVYNNLLSSGLFAGQVIFVPAQPPSDGC